MAIDGESGRRPNGEPDGVPNGVPNDKPDGAWT